MKAITTTKHSVMRLMFSMIMLCLAGVESAYGLAVTYSVTSTSTFSSSGDAITGASVSYSQTHGTAEQMTSGNSATLTITSMGGIGISNFTLSMKSNSKGGAGKLKYSTDGGKTYTYLVGSSSEGVAFNQSAWYSAWSTSYVNISKEVTLSNVSQLIIMIEATANSLYCQSYSITYTAGSGKVCAYDANGGTGTMTDLSSPYSSGATVTVLSNSFTRVGYTFDHWDTKADDSGTDYAPGDQFTISASTTLYAQWRNTYAGEEFTLVEDLSNLSDGSKIILLGLNSSTYYAMTRTQNENYRGAVVSGTSEFTMSNSNKTVTLGASTSVQVITLEATNTTNIYELYVENGYLYAASSTANYMRTQTEHNTNDTKFTIGLSEGVSSLIAASSSNRNHMRFNYNNNNPLIFSCYASTSTLPTPIIYVLEEGTKYDITWSSAHGTEPTSPTSAAKVTLPALEEDGWTHTGWKANQNVTNTANDATITAGTLISNSTKVQLGANTTFTAQWSANTISLTLDKNNSDESGSTDGSASIKFDATALEAGTTHATRNYYILEGYYADPECTHKVLTSAGELVNYTGYVVSGKWARATTPTTLYANWTAKTYNDYKFSCAEITLTCSVADTVFITSSASKTVRSQQAFHLTGSGLTPSTNFTFSFGNSDLNSRFAFKLADGGNVATNSSGTIDSDIYVYYTPTSGDTDDGLNIATNLTVTMTGAKSKSATLNTKTIIGRHLPANFVIAAKRNGKWLALPSNMSSTSNPSPVEIAVDDSDNPSIAYTATSNIYTLYDQGEGETVKLAMHGQSNAPLFGSASTAPIGKSGNAIVTNTLNDDGYFWKFAQKRATGLSTPQEAKYLIYCKNNSTNHLRLKENAGNPIWGLYDSGVEELRLIPASSVANTESEVVAWGQKKLILEVALPTGATQARAKITGGSWSANKSLATTTGTSGNGTATKYNYTLDFTSDNFDFAANEGKMLIVELLNSEGTTLKATSVLIPRIIAAGRTINKTNDGTKGPWNTEVHVLPGVKLIVDAGTYTAPTATTITLKELNIYPGATVDVESGTLIATTLILRNGWDRLSGATKKYDVAHLYLKPSAGSLTTTNFYADWYIDYDQYYPIAVPWNVTIASITYKNSNSSAAAGMKLRYFDGAERANPATSVSNWKQFGGEGNRPTPTYLEPSKGYALTAKRPSGKAFAILRMPLTIPSASWTALGEQGNVTVETVTTHKDTVHVTGWGVGNSNVPWYAIGWNFIANPYMATFKCVLDEEDDDDIEELAGKIQYENGTEVRYVNIPDIDFQNFDQVNVTEATIKPSSGFFIQAKDATEQAITFNSSKIVAPSAPERYLAASADAPDQEAYIRLTGESSRDQMGLIIGSDYTEAYDFNADLAKLLGEANALKTYLHYTDMDFAYLAINEQLASEEIPVTVKIPATGEYTYSLRNSSTVDQLEGLYLVDYQTGITTNLIYDDYTFTSTTEGTIGNRFAINAIVGERQVPTEVDISGADKDGTAAVKFIWHDKVYVLHNNVIYDSTGKRVYEINK